MTPIPMRFGGYQPPASVHNQAAEIFGAALRTQLGDQVEFSLDGNILASGHQAADLLSMVESGALTWCYFSASYLAEHVPAFALLDLPFLLNDRAKAYAVLDGPLGFHLADQLAEVSGFRLLGWWDNGFRHLTNSVRPIRNPADCQGLRIRTLRSDLHQRVFRLLGFEPVALDVKDLLAGVEAGTIEAQENPLTNIFNFGIHERHRHITLCGHFFGAAALLCHQDSYHRWPVDVQHAVTQAAAEATRAQRQFAAAEDDEVMSKLDPAQNEIVHLTETERTRFVHALAPLVSAQRAIFGDELFCYLE
jgi:tripartite ATP-independent transporter DctP family solute receptor